MGTAEILSIVPAGRALVYDLKVAEDQSYASLGALHHNSSDMNLQNIPKWLAGYNIKKLFKPSSDDLIFVNSDYKGAEVRVFTAYAPDAKLIQALRDGMDMHSYFASVVFQRPYDDYANRDNATLVPDATYRKQLDMERQQIKRVVFGILYGAGAGKIAETIGVTPDQAQGLIDMLFAMFPAIKNYVDSIDQEVDRNGFVETLFGRRRRFPLARISRFAGRAKRQARNFKIQSTSSDIVLAQLIEMNEPLKAMGGRLLLTVHDSIAFEFPKARLGELEGFLRYYGEERVAQKFPWLPVPFKMDIEVGPNYGECIALEKYLAKHPVAPRATEGVIEEAELLNELREDAFADAH